MIRHLQFILLNHFYFSFLFLFLTIVGN